MYVYICVCVRLGYLEIRKVLETQIAFMGTLGPQIKWG